MLKLLLCEQNMKEARSDSFPQWAHCLQEERNDLVRNVWDSKMDAEIEKRGF